MQHLLIGLIVFISAQPLTFANTDSDSDITGNESYPLYSFFIRENSDFRRKHNLFPDGYVSNIANDALKPGTKRDGYLTNMLEVQSYNTIDYLMSFGRFFSLSPILCRINEDDRFEGDDCLKPDINPVQVTVRETYGHRLYTPKTEYYKGRQYIGANEKIVDPAEFDRPFASWFYYNKTLEIDHGRIKQLHTTSLGLVGEAAMGRATQEWAHKYPFSGPQKIQGWETQVDHRIALQYHNKLSIDHRPIYDQSKILGLQFSANSYLDVGNIIQSAGLSVGAKLSVGGKQYCLPHEWQFSAKGINSDTLPKNEEDTNSEQPNSCFNIKPWLVFDAEYRKDRVFHNYLIEDGIHVPANVITQEELDLYTSLNTGSDLPAINPILVTGGELSVNLRPYVSTFTTGVTAFDMVRIGYMKRTEETYEQDEKHEWLEVQVNVKGDGGWLFLPLFLAYQSFQKQLP